MVQKSQGQPPFGCQQKALVNNGISTSDLPQLVFSPGFLPPINKWLDFILSAKSLSQGQWPKLVQAYLLGYSAVDGLRGETTLGFDFSESDR